MKTHRPLIIALLAMAAGIAAIQLTSLHATNPAYIPRQVIVLTLGICTLAAMCILGERRLSRYGFIVTIAVMILCWINPSRFNPGQWLPPACVLGLPSVRYYKGDSLTLALIALFSFIASMSLIHTPAGSLSCIAIGLLYGYTVKPHNHRKIKWALAIALGLTPFIFRSLSILHTFPTGFSLDALTWTYARCVRILLANAPWFGPSATTITTTPFDPSLMGMLTYVTLHCGKAALICTLGFWTALAACIFAATRRCATPTHRILILGGGFILTTDMIAAVIKTFSSLTFVQYLQPFLTPGGSAAVASFMTLGLVIAGLATPRRRSILAASAPHGFFRATGRFVNRARHFCSSVNSRYRASDHSCQSSKPVSRAKRRAAQSFAAIGSSATPRPHR